LPKGIILKGIGGLYTIKSEQGVYRCKARGLFRKQNIKPVPGDSVTFEIIDEAIKEGYLITIHKRKNNLIRPAVSNIDQSILVISIKNPKPDLLLLDKLICLCESIEVIPIICINKTDLALGNEINIIKKQYIATGYTIVEASITNDNGIDQIAGRLANKTSVFAGQSGVGKSSILNRIFNEIKMETGEISKKLKRGKHTTRHAEFIEINNGYLVDTPGFSNFDIGLIDANNVKYYYREFNKYEDTCKFNGCIHINEPKCSVKEAVQKGEIDINRYNRYIEIHNLAKQSEKEKRGY